MPAHANGSVQERLAAVHAALQSTKQQLKAERQKAKDERKKQAKTYPGGEGGSGIITVMTRNDAEMDVQDVEDDEDEYRRSEIGTGGAPPRRPTQ